jgi:hypothetical protein
MRLPSLAFATLRPLLLASSLLLAGLAHAASIQITSGSVAGNFGAQAGANGQVLDSSATLVDASVPGSALAGNGLFAATADLLGAGLTTTLARQWTAGVSLDATDPANLQFRIGASSALGLSGSGNFEGGNESTAVLLDADLAVISGTEGVGTPVRLQFTGSAQSQYSTGLPLIDVVPSFDIVVRDAQGNILSSWQGLLAGTNVGFDFSVDTRVGDSLQFSLSHASTSLLGVAAAIPGSGLIADTSALLTGRMRVNAVPEPGSLALLLVALAAMGVTQQRPRIRC